MNYYISLILIFSNLLSFFGGIVYYFYALNIYGVIASLTLTIPSFVLIKKFISPADIGGAGDSEPPLTKGVRGIFLIPYLLIISACFYILFSSQTAKSIISPWQVVPEYFFALYGIATLILFLHIFKNGLNIFFISIHALLSFSVAVIIYKIGYGFDPFIHEATLDLINKNGFVEPKPMYYLGQYSWIIIVHKLSGIPIAWLNKLIIPLFASILLPFYSWQTLKKYFQDKKLVAATILALLILPFSIFIITTPQNLAYLYLILVIMIALDTRTRLNRFLVYSLTLAALITQPIAGIPALTLSLLTAIHNKDLKSKKLAYAAIAIVSALSIPALFYSLDSKINLQSLKSILPFSKITIPFQENFIYNFLYLYAFNVRTIIILLVLAGLFIFYKKRAEYKILSLYLLSSISFFVSYFITKNISFSYLIDYERDAFADRLLVVSLLFLLPFIILALYKFNERLFAASNPVRLPIMFFISILITASLYISYPRFDKYHNSKGFSTDEHDIDAVNLIKDWAEKDYIVLANQQVSAAALHEYGFDHYHNNQFYYPIPTSGPLYQFYLDMVYKKPRREIMEKAMDLAGVDESYFVINKYWWASNKIVDEAKLEADEWRVIGDNDIYIFKYRK